MSPRLASSCWVAALVSLTVQARAADPTTADCLSASDASLRAGNEHKLRSERTQLLVCAAPSCPADIRKECTRRVDEVNLAIPTVVFEAKDANGNDLSAVRVTMDGEVIAERLEGSALSLDPGEHAFVFEAAGQAPVTKQLVIREAEKERREAIRFGVVPTEAPVAQPSAPVSPPPADENQSTWSNQKTAAVVAASVGVVGLGVGSVFGLRALSKKSHANDICPDACSDDEGLQAWRDARSAGNVSTIFFIVGGAALGAGAALWFTAPKAHATTQVGFGPGSVAVRGSF